MVLAAMLVMTDLTRHILLDAGLFEDALAMNDADGGLSFAGHVGRATTWCGFILLFVSVAFFVRPTPKIEGKLQPSSRFAEQV
jgi:hypothetical protein